MAPHIKAWHRKGNTLGNVSLDEIAVQFTAAISMICNSFVSASIASFLILAKLINVAACLLLKVMVARKRYIELASRLQGYYLLVFTWLYECRSSNLKVYMSGDHIPNREVALMFSNHVTADFPLLSLAARLGTLGSLKAVVKDTLFYVPFFGMSMWLYDFFFLRRDWGKDRKSIRERMKHLQSSGLPMQILIFPEGTRKTPAKVAESRSYAAQTANLPELRHVLIPRTKGFVELVSGLRDSGTASHVYDVTVAYSGWSKSEMGNLDGPRAWSIFFPSGPVAMHVHTKRYALSDLPSGREELANWCITSFQKKDKLLADFHKQSANNSRPRNSRVRTPSFPGAEESPYPDGHQAAFVASAYLATFTLMMTSLLVATSSL